MIALCKKQTEIFPFQGVCYPTTKPFSQFVIESGMICEQINQNQISMNPKQISQAAFVNYISKLEHWKDQTLKDDK